MKNRLPTIVFIFLFTISLVSLAVSISVVYPALAGKILVLCSSCISFLLPFFQKTSIVLFLITLSSFFISLFRTIYFSRNVEIVTKKSTLINKIANKYSLHDKLIVFKHDNPIALCAGIIQPKIYLSRKLLKIMNPVEIETIIVHEKQHLNRNDNLFHVLLNAIKNTFFFFPIIGDWVNYFDIRKEILADEGTIKELGQKHSLISALRKVIDYQYVNNLTAGSYFSGDDIEPRVRHLLGNNHIKYNMHVNKLLLSLSVLFLFGNVLVSKVEIHAQTQLQTSICLDNPTCQNECR